MLRIFAIGLAALFFSAPVMAQTGPVQDILQAQTELIQKSSRKTIEPAIAAVAGSGLPQAQSVLEAWQAKDMWLRKSDGLYFRAEQAEGKTYRLLDFDSGDEVGTAEKGDLKQIKPNSGIRALIGSALTTALAFAVLLFSPLVPFQQFGLVTGITILYALIASIAIVPPMLIVWAAYHQWRAGMDH